MSVTVVGPVAAAFVSAKVAGVATPATLADTEYAPAVVLAVNCGAVATPSLPETAVAVAPVAPKVPLAPFAGAAKVTVAPATG